MKHTSIPSFLIYLWPLAKYIGVAVLACFALWLLLDGCYREPVTFLGLPE